MATFTLTVADEDETVLDKFRISLHPTDDAQVLALTDRGVGIGDSIGTKTLLMHLLEVMARAEGYVEGSDPGKS